LPPPLSKILLGAKFKSTDKEGLFIRPEHLIVTKSEKDMAIKGIVYQTYYYGSHSELAIRVERGLIITVKTTYSHSFERGNVVYVSLLQ
jgi:ABC-type Fe3+/spermidine/putrescine transport system ATPase subunit